MGVFQADFCPIPEEDCTRNSPSIAHISTFSIHYCDAPQARCNAASLGFSLRMPGGSLPNLEYGMPGGGRG